MSTVSEVFSIQNKRILQPRDFKSPTFSDKLILALEKNVSLTIYNKFYVESNNKTSLTKDQYLSPSRQEAFNIT